MTRETTSLPAPSNARAEWKNYLAFVKRPALPERAAAPGVPGLMALQRMLGLDLAFMMVLISLAGLAVAVGVDLPETALAGLEIDFQLALTVVLIAPLAEEILFRGWLSGRPGHVLALVVMAAGGLVVAIALANRDENLYLAAGATIALLSIAVIFLLRKRPAMAWFRAIFPLLFWLSTAAFASIHLLNYQEGSLGILLPLVLPQFLLGTILAYMRVNYGLWSCVLLHALHNGLILGAVALAETAFA
ncbi:MAG: type II CAAX prenyl endopeptidase Rce1 family protein [Erythrobacter sp.]